MNNNMDQIIKDYFRIDDDILALISQCEDDLKFNFIYYDKIAEYHQNRILKAFKETNISDIHFSWNTGYGYDDIGRDAVEKVFAKVFCGEKALVRPNIVNGTHAISLALLGLLKSGDKIIYCTGTPYDTLKSVIGYHEGYDNHSGTLKDLGVNYQEIPLISNKKIDIESLSSSIDSSVKMIAIQRSKGYSLRKSITVNQIKEISEIVHKINPNIIVMVDNCYTEFVEEDHPISLGADIICGSLIKNPGGGLALTGGYLVGRGDLIDLCSYRLTCPGIGAECGLTFGQNRSILQGLFTAPTVVASSMKGSILCGLLFKKLGFNISPDVTILNNDSDKFDDVNCRSDIIQAVTLNNPDAVQAFCKGIQSASPVDASVTPVPSPMPGYRDDIIMAAGTFVQGASIELSADGPLREPYNVYFQGGITYPHAKIGIMMAAQELKNKGFITI